MGVNPGIELFDKKGLRTDGRKPDEIRPLHIEAGVLHRADGSAYLEWGNNKVMAAVYGPREYQPRRFQKADKCVVRAKYNMAPFSTSDRKRPGPDRRSQEIGKVIADAFENVILTEKWPRGVIDINMEILQADAGTRIAALVAAAVALADAGIPMKGMVSGCAVGKVDGKLCVDLNGPEDNYGDADLPVAINNATGDIVLLQMDGHLSGDEFDQALDLAVVACGQVYQEQRAALARRFTGALDDMEADAPKASKGKQAPLEEVEV
jgi:exosome complex component RRP41